MPTGISLYSIPLITVCVRQRLRGPEAELPQFDFGYYVLFAIQSLSVSNALPFQWHSCHRVDTVINDKAEQVEYLCNESVQCILVTWNKFYRNTSVKKGATLYYVISPQTLVIVQHPNKIVRTAAGMEDQVQLEWILESEDHFNPWK